MGLAKKTLSATRQKDGSVKFDVQLGSAGGTILAVLPKKLSKLELNVPKKIRAGSESTISIFIKDQNGAFLRGVQPVKVTITDPKGEASEFSDYYSCTNGVLTIDFIAALNDSAGKWAVNVEELISGKTKKANFSVSTGN